MDQDKIIELRKLAQARIRDPKFGCGSKRQAVADAALIANLSTALAEERARADGLLLALERTQDAKTKPLSARIRTIEAIDNADCGASLRELAAWVRKRSRARAVLLCSAAVSPRKSMEPEWVVTVYDAIDSIEVAADHEVECCGFGLGDALHTATMRTRKPSTRWGNGGR